MEIAITGMGAITPLAATLTETWDALLAGRSATRDLGGQLGMEGLPSTLGAPMATDPATVLDRVPARRLDRSQQALLVAAAEAWADAGAPEFDPERLAVVAATGVGGLNTTLEQDRALHERGPRKVSPRTVPMLMPNAGAAQLSITYDAKAGCYTPVSACSSGAEAFVSAARLLETGEADMVIVGGADASLNSFTLSAFAAAGALCTHAEDPARASRPFDRDRNGFILGEGAAVAVLERATDADARGARTYAILAGAAVTSDAHHITNPDPSGEQQQRAMTTAIARAGLTPADIGHVNCHATATTVGDIIETRSIQAAIGDHPVLTAPKSALGHLIGAAGAVEMVLAAMTIHTGTIPPTINLTHPDPAITQPIAITPTVLTGAVLSNSFAFGGQNVSLVLTAPPSVSA